MNQQDIYLPSSGLRGAQPSAAGGAKTGMTPQYASGKLSALSGASGDCLSKNRVE